VTPSARIAILLLNSYYYCTNSPKRRNNRYLGTRLERFNGDFDAPVLLCGGLGCAPMSPSYEILATGCLAADPGPPKKPQRPPLAEADSATSGNASGNNCCCTRAWTAPENDCSGVQWLDARDIWHVLLEPSSRCFVSPFL